MRRKKGRLSLRIWITIILFIFMSSIIGNVESMLLGLYLNNTTFKSGSMGASITLFDTINLIVSLSAVVSLITTFIIGTLSEKLKNRKIFISTGYILWGLVMVAFSFVRGGNIGRYFGYTEMSDIITTTALLIVGFALILAFLRSATCDAAFNSWLTDVSTTRASAKIEIIFTLMGFVSTAVITTLVAKAQMEQMEYNEVFVFLGVMAICIGALGFILITNPERSQQELEANAKTSYWADLFYGFKPKAVKENTNLYLILSSGCLFNCAYQVFFPYLFIYISSVILPANKEVNLASAKSIIPILLSIAFVAILVPKLMKAYPKNKSLSFITSVLCLIVGLLILSSTKSIIGIIIGLAPGLVGYIIIMIQFGATVRDNIPKDKVGLFQGIRMTFLFFIPCVLGPTLGNIATKNSNITYITNGAEKLLPTEDMFLYAAIIATLIFIPMLAFLKKDKEKRLKKQMYNKKQN